MSRAYLAMAHDAADAATMAYLAKSDPKAAAAIMKRQQIVQILGLSVALVLVGVFGVAIWKSPRQSRTTTTTTTTQQQQI